MSETAVGYIAEAVVGGIKFRMHSDGFVQVNVPEYQHCLIRELGFQPNSWYMLPPGKGLIRKLAASSLSGGVLGVRKRYE